VHALRDAIQRCLDAWNENCHPFKWVKAADDIMAKAKPKVYSDSGHSLPGSTGRLGVERNRQRDQEQEEQHDPNTSGSRHGVKVEDD
jgi:hypothetical protein